MFKILFIKITNLLALFAIIFYFNSCKDNAVTTQTDNLDLSYNSTTDTVDTPGILVLDTVKVLIKDIKLNGSGQSDSSNFKTGPFVMNLNFQISVTGITSAFVPVGTYDKIIFDVHKLNTNETVPDPEFIDSVNSYSVVAKGSFNGTRFVFKSDKSAHQKITFPGSLVVQATGKSNITLQISPYIWLKDANLLCLDPNDPNNHSTIDNNIKDNINGNFKAFKDDDKNGLPD